ncbi:MAG TPA: EpsI family protein [Candidatus Krumholzibacteria bacterium]|nr:EpsI family protein [Candidatus Krumholzibacteria bacterium]
MRRSPRALILGVGFLGVAFLSHRLQTPVAEADWSKDFADSILQGAQVTVLPVSLQAREALGVDRYRFVEVKSEDWAPVWIYAGYYAGQRTNAQVHAPEHCYPGAGWEIVDSEVVHEDDSVMRQLLIEKQGEKRLVWYAYRTRRGQVTSALGLKLDQMLSSLRGSSRDALLLRLSTPVLDVEGESVAQKRLARSWDSYGEEVLRYFDERGGQ